MELAQAVDTTIPNTESVTTAFGVTPTMIFWSIVAVVAVALVIWAAAKYAERGGYNNSFQGSKGGKVKKTVTEYEEEVERI